MSQVPSWMVTAAMLESWGFPVRVTDKCVGSQVTVSEGQPFGKALFAAWAAGHVRIAVTPEHVVEERRQAFHDGLAEMRREAQASLVMLQELGLISKRA